MKMRSALLAVGLLVSTVVAVAPSEARAYHHPYHRHPVHHRHWHRR